MIHRPELYKDIFNPEEPEEQEELDPEELLSGIRELQKAGILE